MEHHGVVTRKHEEICALDYGISVRVALAPCRPSASFATKNHIVNIPERVFGEESPRMVTHETRSHVVTIAVAVEIFPVPSCRVCIVKEPKEKGEKGHRIVVELGIAEEHEPIRCRNFGVTPLVEPADKGM